MEAITVTRVGGYLIGLAPGEDVVPSLELVPGEETFDAQGNYVRADPSTETIVALGVAPMTPAESAETFGPSNEGGFVLYLPAGSAIRSEDLIEVRGESGFQVWGGSADWVSPFTGWAPGEVVTVKRGA